MRLILIGFVALSGCVQGPPGPPGEPGAPGDDGVPAGGLVWKDATGAVVGPTTQYVDSRGHFWSIDFETAKPLIVEFGVYFESTDCTGTMLVVAYPPRVPFRILGEPQFRVRPDSAQSTITTAKSYRDAAQCTALGAGQKVRTVPLASMPADAAIGPPSIAFAPPLHQEKT